MTQTTENSTGIVYSREGYVSTDLQGTPRGEGFDLTEVAIATYLDPATGEVSLKTFTSERFGDGEKVAQAYAAHWNLHVVSIVVGEQNDTMGTVSAWVRR